MKILSPNNFLFVLLLLSTTFVAAQTHFTPYDDCPGIIKSYKPAYNVDYPDWAKMLYQYPVNFQEITAAYDSAHKNRAHFGAIIRYYKIWNRQIQNWVNEDDEIALPNLEKYYQQLNQSQLDVDQQRASFSKTASDWTFLGPKETFWLNESGSPEAPKSCPWQVNIYSFDVSASDPNTLYCGTETGFVNKSTDHGNSWTMLGLNYNFGGGVIATAIHPTDPDIAYVAAGNQLHKTIDGGATWAPLLALNNLFNADRLAIDSTHPNKIIASSNNGVYISLDGGQSWEHPWTSPSYDIQIKLDNSSTVFALTETNGNFAIAVSTDGGLSFQLDNDFPTGISEVSGGLLAATVADPNVLLTILLSADDTPFLYKKTIDTGVWELLATGQTDELPLNNWQGYFDLVLGVSPTDPDVIFVGTSTLYKSSDGGQTFGVVGGYGGDFAIHPDQQDIKILPNGATWISTDGGLSYSSDHFTSTDNYVAKINGIVGSDMWGFGQGWNEDVIVGGRYHNGNTAITDFYGDKALRMGGAESPTGWVLQGKSRHVAFDDLGNGWILPKTAESAPEGRFIFSKYPNMDEYGGRRSNLFFHPNYYETIYLGEENGFWKSTDMGVTFDLLHDFNGRVRYVDISYSDPNTMYADIIDQGLFKSMDGGYTWEARPALSNAMNGGNYWRGKTFFVISPSNPEVLYACLQNGTWSSDIGRVFKSIDGGNSWEDWTGSLSVYTKNLVIQPDANGDDLVYLFSNGLNGQSASVFKRTGDAVDWEPFENDYPAGTQVNLALPFYRDSKIRVAGNAGVWESPMSETAFQPIINPWVGKSDYNCMLDTLYFDDHSIINHENVTWHWEISPAPLYFEDANIRNPRVVLGSPGTYDVTLEVTKDGVTYTKYIPDMVSTTTCPSIEDCSNPAKVAKNAWELVYVDSEEVNSPGLATMAFDDDVSTIWHTRWSTGSDPYPHEIQIDMGEVYSISKFEYLARSNGSNGRIKEYELYFSETISGWGDPVTGVWEDTAAPQTIDFENPILGRYFRLVALSEVNDNAWTSAAEFSVVGCRNWTVTRDIPTNFEQLKAFPVPTSGQVKVVLPKGTNFNYSIFSSQAKLMKKGVIENASGHHFFNLDAFPSGIYLIKLEDANGLAYRVKVVKA